MSYHNRSNNSSFGDADPVLVVTGVVMALLFFVAYIKPEIFYTPWLYYSKANAYVYWIFASDPKTIMQLKQFFDWSSSVNTHNITTEQFEYVNHLVGGWGVKWLYIGIMAVLLLKILSMDKKKEFKLFDLEELIKIESKVWAPLQFFVKHNPVEDADYENGKFPFRKSPYKWVKEHKVLKKIGEDSTGRPKVEINQEKFNKRLADQLGLPYKSTSDLLKQSLEYKTVLVFCLNRLVQKEVIPGRLQKFVRNKWVKKVLPILDRVFDDSFFRKYYLFLGHLNGEDVLLWFIMNYYSAPDKTMENEREEFEAIIDTLLESHLASDKVKFFVKGRHAYPGTLLIRAIKEARTFGILPSAYFPYLRVYDPKLSFLVNDVGKMGRYSMEVSAIFAHYMMEIKVGRAVIPPMYEGRVKLRDELVEYGIIKDDENE